ncbi:uncharacterized protein HaLaN_01316 [Haematococcus lacustris]|uniref:Uncharacterized protein n=1 Tax=Haematococcus lacustris TaxID=44745 RepID=A0A699Y8Z9_HAELA|nr:uncharacterized protein HaLaN_01316 [Haematococcus lacustris]
MAAEADIKGLRLLLEVGGAMVDTKDRWGHTALDEAKRVDASPVIAYLAPLMLLAAEGKIRCAAKPMAPRLQVLMATQPALLLTAGFPRLYLTPGASQVVMRTSHDAAKALGGICRATAWGPAVNNTVRLCFIATSSTTME